MAVSLDDVELKIARSRDQAEALQEEIVEFCEDNPISLRAAYRSEKRGVNLICQMDQMRIPLKEWSIKMGEAVYSLRSALDNLIFACARIKSDPPTDPRALKFPIIQDRTQYQNAARKIAPQLPRQISELLEKIQPFQRDQANVGGEPEYDPLVLLNWISNHDKHRMPIPFLIPPSEIHFSQACKFESEEDACANTPPDVLIHTKPLEHDEIVMEYRTKHPVQWVQGNFTITANVAFESHKGVRGFNEAINQLTWYTGLVIDEFKKHVP